MSNQKQEAIQPGKICELFVQKFSKDYKAYNNNRSYKILKKNITKGSMPLYTLSFTVLDKKNKKVEILATQTDFEHEVEKNLFIYSFLTDHGFGTKDYAAPKSIGQDDSKRFFFREMRDGEVLIDILNREKNYKFFLQKAARWSAKLHNIDPSLYEHKTEIQKKTDYYKNVFGTKKGDDKFVKNFVKSLNKNYQGDIVKKITKLFKALEMPIRAEGERLDNENLCLIHGDFHGNHVFFDDKKVFVIDFDWAGIWHPYWDLGRFCSYFIKYFPKKKQEEYQNIFLREYLKTRKLKHNYDDIIKNKTFLFAQAFTAKDIIIEHLTYIKGKKAGSSVPQILDNRHKSFKKLVKFTDFLEEKISELY